MGVFDGVTTRVARPLPVILLVDASGSMDERGKMAACNAAVREMLASLQEVNRAGGAIQVGVITFSGQTAVVHRPLGAVADVAWVDIEPSGRTPMGDAFRLAAIMVEDPDQVPSRSFQPTIVLISDGIPTDDWELSLQTLEASGRASRALRLAVAIDMEPDTDEYAVLLRFVGSDTKRVFSAREADGVTEALKWVTFSVASRMKSSDPDQFTLPDPGDVDF